MASEQVRQWARRGVTLAVLVALLSPVIRNEDGLPLSTYPMYAGTRADVVAIVTAVGLTANGDTRTLSMPEIADTRDPLIAQAFLNDAVGRGDVASICEEIAARVDPDLFKVEIATERHNVVNHARGEASLLGRQLHAECPVGP